MRIFINKIFAQSVWLLYPFKINLKKYNYKEDISETIHNTNINTYILRRINKNESSKNQT